MNFSILLCSIAFLYVSHPVDGSKILGVFWTPSKSHHILGSALLQALAKKGHDVTLMSPFIDDVNIPTFKQLKLDGIEGVMGAVTVPNAPFFQTMSSIFSSVRPVSKKFWENKAIQDLIKSKESYDVIISIPVINDFLLGLFHHLGLPVIIFNPSGGNHLVNKYVANPTLSYCVNLHLDVGSPETFRGRLVGTTFLFFFNLVEKFIFVPIQEEIMWEYITNSPPISQLVKNVSLVLVNSHLSIESPRPYVPNMVQIGGFYAQTVNKLPDDLQKYLDSAKDGAVLFSFGTNMKIKDMDKDKLNAILEGMRKISPKKVLFKSEVELKDAPKNVLVKKWLPQNDILAHPNIMAFITHGGLGGNTEAVYHGVPMLGVPLFADQKTNIENAVKAGYAVRIFYEDISQKTVDEALDQILKNQSYTKMAEKRSSLLRKQPMNPMDKAIWWVEHIIEHKGGDHLRNLGMDLEWYQLYMVDVMLFYLVVILIFSTTSLLTLRWVIRKLFCRSSQKKTKKD